MKLKRRNSFPMLILCCTILVCLLNNALGQADHLTLKSVTTSADTSQFGKMNAISPDQLLKGRVSGVRVSETDGNPLGAITTTIRGVNSMRGNSDPLWIVDGAILNPSQLEVEQMFWQSAYRNKDFTSVQNTLATINPGDIEKIEVIKDLAATAIYGARGANEMIIITTKQTRQQERSISWSSNVSLSTYELGEEMLNLSDYKNFQQQIGNNVTAMLAPVNWTDEALKGRVAISHNHNLSVGGTEKKMNYYISGFYRQIEGVVKQNNSTLGGLRINIDMNANELFTFGIRIGLLYVDISMAKGANPFGELSTITSIKRSVPDLNARNTFASWQADYDDNSTEYRITPSLYFALKPSKAIKFSTNFGSDFRGKDRSSWLGNRIALGYENNGAASLSTLTVFSYNFNSVLSYTINNNDNNLSVSAGTEILSRHNTFDTMNGTDFFSHELRAKGVNLASSKADIHKFSVWNEQIGFFGTLSYNYQEKYGINGILKIDKTRKQEDNYDLYPAISGWIKVKDYDNSQNSGLISSVYMRAGLGKAGNGTVVPSEFISHYYSGPDVYFEPVLSPFFNMFLKTESREFSTGIEIGLLNDRLIFNGTYYYKITDDRIILNSFGEGFGKNEFWHYTTRRTFFDHLCQLSNKGLELDLRADIIKSDKWNWDLSFNGATNKNRVELIAVSIGKGGLIGSGIYANNNQAGSPVSALWGYREAGIYTTGSAPTFLGTALKTGDIMYKDLTFNGDVNPSDKEVIGNPHPRFFGGLNSNLSYGHFSLDILIDGAYGHDILNLDRMLQENVSGSGNISAESFTKAYNYTNVAEYPSVKALGVGEISDRYVEKGNYTRLSEVKAEYEVSTQKISWIKSLKLNLSIYNALTYSSGKRWNPEINSFGFDNSRLGISYGAYPETRFFTLGVNATF